MLTKRIIPCLDVKDGRTVKGVNFVNLRDAGDAVELGKVYTEQGADELVFGYHCDGRRKRYLFGISDTRSSKYQYSIYRRWGDYFHPGCVRPVACRC